VCFGAQNCMLRPIDLVLGFIERYQSLWTIIHTWYDLDSYVMLFCKNIKNPIGFRICLFLAVFCAD
jgi:hypothetical protein